MSETNALDSIEFWAFVLFVQIRIHIVEVKGKWVRRVWRNPYCERFEAILCVAVLAARNILKFLAMSSNGSATGLARERESFAKACITLFRPGIEQMTEQAVIRLTFADSSPADFSLW